MTAIFDNHTQKIFLSSAVFVLHRSSSRNGHLRVSATVRLFLWSAGWTATVSVKLWYHPGRIWRWLELGCTSRTNTVSFTWHRNWRRRRVINVTVCLFRSPGTGPQSDKSQSALGYYVYFESSSPVAEGHYAIFATPWLSASHENICVSFWFSMEGDIGMGFLDVYMDVPGQQEPATIFQTDGPHGKDWVGFYEQIRVPVQHSFRLRFIATRGKSFRSDIAVDEYVTILIYMHKSFQRKQESQSRYLYEYCNLLSSCIFS